MKRRDKDDIPQERDRHLDVPAEANRDKHINFLEKEEKVGVRRTEDCNEPYIIPHKTPLEDRPPEGGNRA